MTQARAPWGPLFHNSPLPSIVVDVEACSIADANDAAINWLGMDRAEICRRSTQDLLVDPPTEETYYMIATRGERARLVHTVRTASGDRLVEMFSSPSDTDHHSFLQMIDITAEVAAHDRLQRHNDGLERHSEALSTLASRISHDLRGPLSTVAGLATLLGTSWERLGPKRREEALERLRATSDGLSSLVTSVVAQARSERDVGSTSRKVEDLFESVRRVLDAAMHDTGGQFVFDTTIGELPIEVATAQTAVLNVVENAIKYAHPYRPLLVEVSAAPLGEGGVQIDVVDNGIGFGGDPMSLVGSGARGGNVGTIEGDGLGLAYALRTARELDGDLTISTTECGSRVTITIPRQPEVAIAPGPKEILRRSEVSGLVLDLLPTPTAVIDYAKREIILANQALAALVGNGADLGGADESALFADRRDTDRLRAEVLTTRADPAPAVRQVHTNGGVRPMLVVGSTVDGTSTLVVQVFEPSGALRVTPSVHQHT